MMTKRDFFRLIIKIFGLYSLILTVFTVIPNNISNLLYQYDIRMIAVILAIMCISVGLFFVLLFKTDSIITILKLEKGFDEEKMDIGNLNSQSILKLALILIGGFLVLDYVPSFLFELVNAFKYKVSDASSIEGYSVDYFGLSTGIINIVIGFLLVMNYKSIAHFLDKN
ncbi:MAG: hypothetical protein JNJ52_00505 [Flavobacterium sp.]|nr:hypothetical protein [Flavobacterium sp.]